MRWIINKYNNEQNFIINFMIFIIKSLLIIFPQIPRHYIIPLRINIQKLIIWNNIQIRLLYEKV